MAGIATPGPELSQPIVSQAVPSHGDIDGTAPIKSTQIDDGTHPLNRIVTGGNGPSAHLEDTHGAFAVPEEVLAELAVANRILAHYKIVDALGHVSMRHPLHPKTHFLLARNQAPGLVLSADVVVYRIEDAEPELAASAPRGYIERYIHSEIYKRYSPDHVSAIAHVHTPALIPFGLAPKLPFKAAIQTAGFLGSTPAPVWDIASQFGHETDLLVRSPATGAYLARAFEPIVEEVAPVKEKEKKKHSLFSKKKAEPEAPVTTAVKPRGLVLMRGHGATVVAPSLKVVVARAIYAERNATTQLQLHSLLGGLAGLALDETEHQGVTMLSEGEAHLTDGFPQVERAWPYWATEAMSGARF